MKIITYLLTIISVVLFFKSNVIAAPNTPNKFNLCLAQNGSIVAKSKCSKNETQATTNSLTKIGPQGPQGIQGPQGPQGIQGPQGVQGVPGVGSFESIPSGRTVKGLISDTFCVNSAVGRSLFTPLLRIGSFENEKVVIKANSTLTNNCPNLSDCLHSEEVVNQDLCSGDTSNPTAPPGVVCIYPVTFEGILAAQATGRGGYGFKVTWVKPADELCTLFEGIWAFTAP